MENPGMQLPPLPPKGADGTDAAVIAGRKVELEKLLKGMLGNVDVPRRSILGYSEAIRPLFGLSNGS